LPRCLGTSAAAAKARSAAIEAPGETTGRSGSVLLGLVAVDLAFEAGSSPPHLPHLPVLRASLPPHAHTPRGMRESTTLASLDGSASIMRSISALTREGDFMSSRANATDLDHEVHRFSVLDAL